TRVGGIAEVVTKDNGILLDGRSAEDLTYALSRLSEHQWDHEKIAENVKYLDWSETARQLHQTFSQSLAPDKKA
ncbi:MAG: glycosyltransferase family 4 protein, partial [Alphaproteobacteria bacterium]|nr:glycosyltransferase family 4 protein [Alphaproteobacteria bacterium]